MENQQDQTQGQRRFWLFKVLDRWRLARQRRRFIRTANTYFCNHGQDPERIARGSMSTMRKDAIK